MCIGFTVLCAIAVLVWRLLPDPDLIPDLRLCEGIPCYRGITLNKTTLAETKAIFKNAPGFSLNPDDEGGVIANGPIQTVIPFSGYNGVIFEMIISVREGEVPLSAVIAQLGLPCAVYPSPTAPYESAVLSFRDRLVSVKGDERGIQPDSPVLYFDLGPYRPAADGQAKQCRMIDAKYDNWRGFRRY